MDHGDAALVFVGHIETPYTSVEECPRFVDADGPACRIVVAPPWVEALSGIEAGDVILVLYWLHLADRGRLRQSRPGSSALRGTFDLRSPHRPNPIGAAELTVEAVSGGVLTVRGLDCVDGTPLLDIKPARHRGRVSGV